VREHAAELASKNEVWLILEDDASVSPRLLEDWQQHWPYVPAAWDILRLGWFGRDVCSAAVNSHTSLAQWADPPPRGPCRFCGSHAYVVNPASIDKVVRRLEASRIMHVDCLLGAPTPPTEIEADIPPLLSFAVRPSLVMQNSSFPTDRTDHIPRQVLRR